MGFKEGECFKCGVKLYVGSVCDQCARAHDIEERLEEGDLV